jgi:allantoinase
MKPTPDQSWKSTLLWAFRSMRVVTPEGTRPATILVKQGRILEVAPWENVPSEAHLRDYGDYVLLPGLVDTHVHINDPGRAEWEGFQTATQAAAAGGVTTVVDMPLNCIPETISAEALAIKREAVAGRAWVDWMAWAGAVGNSGAVGNTGANGNDADLPGLIAAGVPGFKCFLVHSGIDGFAWIDEPQLRKTMAALWESGLPLLAHAELAGPVDRATTPLQHADWRSYATYLASRPDEAETEAIALLIRLAAEFNTHVHIVHLATAQALPALRQARAAGLKITVETCPQYLWFSAEEIPDGATAFKCAPPIRSAANREALWEALREGLIDMVATDHSPCPPQLKNPETGRPEAGRFDTAWGGIASLGLALPVVWTGLRQRSTRTSKTVPDTEFPDTDYPDTDFALLARWLAAEPARLAGLSGRKGALAAGCDADLVIFDPAIEWSVTPEELLFRHKISPYLGAKLRGRVLETYLHGECIFWRRNGSGLIDPKPQGRELRPNP